MSATASPSIALRVHHDPAARADERWSVLQTVHDAVGEITVVLFNARSESAARGYKLGYEHGLSRGRRGL